MVIGKNYDINKVQYTIIIKTATAGKPAVAVLFLANNVRHYENIMSILIKFIRINFKCL